MFKPHHPTVGYQNSATRSGFNFYAPTFRGINASLDANGLKQMDIQDIQMDDSVMMQAANLQRRNENGKTVEKYVWFDKEMAKGFGLGDGTKGVWANENWTPINPPIILEPGEGVQVDVGPATGVLVTTLAPIEL